MLGRTAGELFWMCRYLERCENTARLIDAGFRMSMTRSKSAASEWTSVLATVGCTALYEERHEDILGDRVIDFLLRDKSNPYSVLTMFQLARENARRTRTALTLELWEAINGAWMELSDSMRRPVATSNLINVLDLIRQQSALIRGCLYGTLLRNDIYRFCQAGQLIERADNTARILDVKYYVLLPTAAYVGSPLDNVQWEMLLRSASAERAFHWVHEGETSPAAIARFLMLDKQLPRSLAYCYDQLERHLGWLDTLYEADEFQSTTMACQLNKSLSGYTINDIFETGLHQFIAWFLGANGDLASQIENDFRFYA